MPDRGAFHRALHRARAAAGTHVKTAQAQLITDLFGVFVFAAADRMTAPADHQVQFCREPQQPGVAQDVEYRVGDVLRGVQIELAALENLVVHEHDVTQHGEQQLAGTADHHTVDKCGGRRPFERHLQPAYLLDEADLESAVFLQHGAGIVGVTAGIQYRQDAAAEKFVEITLTQVPELVRFDLGQDFQAAFRPYLGVDGVVAVGPDDGTTDDLLQDSNPVLPAPGRPSIPQPRGLAVIRSTGAGRRWCRRH